MARVQTIPPPCVLIGPPGAGKSTAGRIAAAELGVAFRDTDDDIAALAGKPIADIFVEDGEAAFRAVERRAVAAALAAPEGVVALGSGAVADPEIQALLADRTVVYLSAQLAAVTRRTAFSSGGQIAGIGTRGMMKLMLDERAVLYRRLATDVIETDVIEIDAVAAELVALLRRK